MSTTTAPTIVPIFLHATPLQVEIKPLKSIKRWHRKKLKPKPGNYKPAKAILPEGKYFYKKPRRNLKKWQAKMRREDENKKKLRGAKKKEAARIEKLLYPKGRPMAKKPAPKHRGILFPSDLERYMHLTPRNARRCFSKIKKRLGKEKEHLVTVEEFCKHKNIPIESIIPYLV